MTLNAALVLDRARLRARETVHEVTRPVFVKQMLWSVGIFALMTVNLLVNIHLLNTVYPNPAQPPDLLLDVFPVSTAWIAVGEVVAGVQVGLTGYVLLERRLAGLPRLIFLLTVMYWLRAYAILLTPLAQIQPPELNYPDSHIIARTFYEGMFFSGHTGSAFVQAFFISGSRLRSLSLVLAAVQGLALLISHSHYSIDVFGAFFVAYFVTHFDFMRLVPQRARQLRFMPWYTG
jgi:hypothetical protein